MNVYIYIFVFIGILGIYCGILKYHNVALENENEKMTTEIAELKVSLEAAKNKVIKVENANIELSKTVNDFKITSQELETKLYKLEKNSSKMIDKHPKLVNNIINNAQKKLNDCFEKITRQEDYESCEE